MMQVIAKLGLLFWMSILLGHSPLSAAEKTITLKAWHTLIASGPFEINWVRGDQESLTINASDQDLTRIKIAQSKTGYLDIGLSGFTSIGGNVIQLTISSPSASLQKVELTGAVKLKSDLTVSSPIYTFGMDLSGACEVQIASLMVKKAEFDLSGSSKLSIKSLSGDDIEFDLTGANEIELGGSAKKVTLEGSGATEVIMKEFRAEQLQVDMSGAASVYFGPVAKIDGSMSGAASLHYKGRAAVNVSASGASSVRSY